MQMHAGLVDIIIVGYTLQQSALCRLLGAMGRVQCHWLADVSNLADQCGHCQASSARGSEMRCIYG
jgi:hypothetical protein